VHLHAAVAGDHRDASLRFRELHPDGGRNGPAHRAEIGGGDVGPRLVGFPVVPGEGTVGAGIDQHHAVARKGLAQLRDGRGRVDRPCRLRAVLDVVEPRCLLDPGEPCSPRRRIGGKRRHDGVGLALHQLQEGAAAPEHDMVRRAMGGQRVHVGVDMDDDGLARRPPAQGPVHRVALVEARAEHDQHIRRIGEDRRRRVAGPGIAEDAERERVVLRKGALGAQRGRHRDRPPCCDGLEERCRLVVLDAGAGEKGDLCSAAQGFDRGNRGGRAQRGDRFEIRGNRGVIRRGGPDQCIVRQRQVHRALGLRPHHGQRATERVIEGPWRRHRFREARDRLHHRGVVECRLARVLELAEPFHVDGYLA
jgi:hypothetical protein